MNWNRGLIFLSKHPRQRSCVTWMKPGKSFHQSGSNPSCWVWKCKDSASVEWISQEKNSQQEGPRRYSFFWWNHLKDLLNINDCYVAGLFLYDLFLHMLYHFLFFMKCCCHSRSLVLRDCSCQCFILFFKMPSLNCTSKVSKLLWSQNIKKGNIILGDDQAVDKHTPEWHISCFLWSPLKIK